MHSSMTMNGLQLCFKELEQLTKNRILDRSNITILDMKNVVYMLTIPAKVDHQTLMKGFIVFFLKLFPLKFFRL